MLRYTLEFLAFSNMSIVYVSSKHISEVEDQVPTFTTSTVDNSLGYHPSQFPSIAFGPELHPQSALQRNMFFTRKVSMVISLEPAVDWCCWFWTGFHAYPPAALLLTPSLHMRAGNSTCQHNPEIFLGASSTLPTIRVPKRCQNTKCSNFESD